MHIIPMADGSALRTVVSRESLVSLDIRNATGRLVDNRGAQVKVALLECRKAL